MPVPRARRSIDLAPLPGARRTAALTPTAAGVGLQAARADVGRAISAVGGEVADIGTRLYGTELAYRARDIQEARQRADQLAIIAADNELATWERDRLYDPEQGALTLKGRDAFGLPETIDAEYSQKAGEIGGRLSTDAQRMAWARIQADRGQRVGLTVRRHVEQEIRTYTAGELQARIDNVIDSAQRNALDPRLIQADVERGEQAIKVLGKQLGFGPEQLEKGIAAMRSTVHLGVIDRLLSEDQSKAAKIYFEEAKGQIAADKIDDVERALRVGSVKKESQEAADQILATYDTLTKQREAAKAIDDPEVRDATLNYIEHEAVVRDREEREAEEARSRGVYDIIDRTGSVRSIPTRVWSQMSGNERSAARHYAELIAGGATQTTDLKTYYGLMQQAMDDPATFARMNLYDLAKSRLTKSDFEQFAGLQLSIRRGEQNKVEDTLGTYSTFTQIFNSTLRSAGIPTDTVDADTVRRRFEDLANAEARARGKKLTSPEIQAILDRLVLTVQEGSILGVFPGIPFYDKRGFETTIDDVPQDQRRQIMETLKKSGQPITPDAVVDLYLRYVQSQQRGR